MYKVIRRILFLLSGFILASGVLLVILVGFNYNVPILMYHSVSPDAPLENRLAVTDATFEKQMKFLKEHRYNVVSLETIVGLIKAKKKIPPKTVAITFDDGYKNNYQYAFPILKKYNLPAALFVIVDEVGRAGNDRLSWQEIKEMQGSGLVAIGSHCLGAEPLVNIASPREVERQIVESKKVLEDKLKQPVEIFSYPEGKFNLAIREMVIAAGYSGAVATNPGRKFSGNDIFAFKRLRISANAGNLFIFWFESSGWYNFFRERRRK